MLATTFPESEKKRFFRYVRKTDGCWLWSGAIGKNGYGYFHKNRPQNPRSILAHRYSYLIHKGEIKYPLEIDHICRVTYCVNPGHLRMVTHVVNLETRNTPRGEDHYRRKRKFCKRGHPFDETNTYIDYVGARQCRKCMKIRWTKYNANARAKARKK